ncbi:MAG: GC-type dockerin domain-anchored protein [Phycisphaerales bacterium JB061]
MPDVLSTIHAISALALTASVGLAQSAIEWASPVDGDFGVATNWFPAVVPGEFDTAVLGGVGAYTVFATDGTLAALDLANPDAVLQVGRPRSGGTPFTIAHVTGPGVLQVSSGREGESARVNIDGVLDAHVRLPGPNYLSATIHGRSTCAFGPSALVTGEGTVEGRWVGPATLHADAPGILNLDGTFTGVTLRSTGGGKIKLTQAALLDSIVESTPDSLYDSGVLTLMVDCVFRGPYHVRTGRMSLSGENVFEDGLYLEDGILDMYSDAVLNTTVRLNPGLVLGLSGSEPANLADSLLTGVGNINGTFSGGTIAIDEPGTLGFRGAYTGGTFRASNGGMLGFESATLTGVTIHIGDGGSITSRSSARLTDTTIEGELVVRPGDSIAFGDGVRADAGVRVNDGSATGVSALRLLEDASLQTRVLLDGRTPGLARLSPADRRARIGDEGVVTGNGMFEGILFVDGTLAPGVDGGAAGYLQMFLDTVVRLEPTARVLIDIAGPTTAQFDRISSAGARAQFRMNGTLRVRFADGYAPQPGDIYEIIRVETLERAFATIDIEDAPGAAAAVGPAHVVYAGSSVLVVVCAADRDGDGELTMFDFIEFRNQFDAGDLRADLDQDGALTIFDFLVFQNRFDAGCD